MKLKGLKIGFCVTGSFCTFDKVLIHLQRIVDEGAEVYPIFSYAVASTDTRFTTAADFRQKVESITGHKVIADIVGAEPIGPKKLLDVVVIAPCTGNTLAKLANGITDTPVLMAAKAHLRNQRPVVIAVSTNDALGNNAKNLGQIMNVKNVYLVPFYQDDPVNKPNSLIADMDKIIDTVLLALEGKQIQPVLIEKKE
ncbi:dipicolinate synthase subunit B [Caldicoprobacter algeriensis]|uniref:dipicolinate synthase subunit B n=1 Tax=Caldicoprobacter algeriensis TaxID=699281 RepID=UPI00207AB34A|nr:dipicolinate synthase subunit B [Caldicoprobacter algeriensis]MCM8900794.1 dipicolinate synthase subunit B [Caldicoprobacter algeriensis]